MNLLTNAASSSLSVISTIVRHLPVLSLAYSGAALIGYLAMRSAGEQRLVKHMPHTEIAAQIFCTITASAYLWTTNYALTSLLGRVQENPTNFNSTFAIVPPSGQ